MTGATALRLACVQLNSQEDKAANVAAAVELMKAASAEGARLVVLPEMFTYTGRRKGYAAAAETLDGPTCVTISAFAREHGVYVLAGSLLEPAAEPGKFHNTSVLYGPDGGRLAVYRKIHLFDAVAGRTIYRESDTLTAGGDLVTAVVDGVTVGLTVCYDLRFPELYRALALRGAVLFLVPSAFTTHTGKDHWEVLLRARAIENGCFVAAPNQYGPHPPERSCYGHSMIVDPWGTVLAEAADGVSLCAADVDPAVVARVRGELPSLTHRRPDLYGR